MYLINICILPGIYIVSCTEQEADKYVSMVMQMKQGLASTTCTAE